VRPDWFTKRVLKWFDLHGRHDLPWQEDIDPYRVWVSEIMLQQTQVTTVIPFYERFIARFPTVAALAGAELDEVLHHWTGLGYYARGRNLHKAARVIAHDLDGRFPVGVEALSELPGIGRSTAGAISAIAQGVRAPILDGNVKRVLARFHAVAGYPGQTATQKSLWELAEAHTPNTRVADYTQAIMDLGATVCTRQPRCEVCPVAERCDALAQGATDDFPGRKPKRSKPTRTARMFLIVAPDGACLLEQRPAKGLWGGLWIPPQRGPDCDVPAVLREFDIPESAVAESRVEPGFRHTFTHFHLDIEPVHVRLRARPLPGVRDGTDCLWYRREDDTEVGLSAPAVALLDSLKEFELA
jgi:A/G-specific adenine glycosylase